MNEHEPSAGDSPQQSRLFPAVIGFSLFLLLVPAMLFISAGTLNWPMGWVYVILLLASTISSRLIALKRHPDLLRERAAFTQAEGTKTWDRVLVAAVGLIGPMAMVIIAGLDQRLGWTSIVPPFGQYLSAILIAVGYGVAVWAMAVNRFFSAVARIQEDRGQYVVTSGPYQFVRHPSYGGGLVASLALPFMLDALWVLIPAIVTSLALVLRTRFEDRMLMEELDGYPEYAQKTPYRMIPLVW